MRANHETMKLNCEIRAFNLLHDRELTHSVLRAVVVVLSAAGARGQQVEAEHDGEHPVVRQRDVPAPPAPPE